MAFKKTKSQTGFDLADVKEFGKALHGGSRKWGDVGQYFDGGESVVVVRAPARLDVMGGIAGSCGSLMCQATLAAGTVLGIQKRRDQRVHIQSLNAEQEGAEPHAKMSLAELCLQGKPLAPAQAQKLLQHDANPAWARHVAGAFCLLLHARGPEALSSGANVVVASDIPWSVGLGSSTAVGVATVHGIDLAYELGLSPAEVASFSHQVETRIVGACAGATDHIAVALGQQYCLLPILCQPDKPDAPVRLPDPWELVAINSKVKHSAADQDHAEVRAAIFMGHRIIVDLMEQDDAPGEDLEQVQAYLCQLSAKDFKSRYEERLPTLMKGQEFLDRYGTTFDRATTIEPDKEYRVRSRTGHVVYENGRAADFLQCVERASEAEGDGPLVEAGRLMYSSHWSYRTRCGLDCLETNFLVRMARNIGIAKGIYGARITGAGLGGAVAILGKKGDVDAGLAELLALYRDSMQIEPEVFAGTSPGAIEFGHERYRP